MSLIVGKEDRDRERITDGVNTPIWQNIDHFYGNMNAHEWDTLELCNILFKCHIKYLTKTIITTALW